MTNPELLYYLFVGFLCASLPAGLIAYLFGGRGLLFAWVAVIVASIAFLVWTFGFASRDNWTGMEGIAFIVFPVIVAVVSVAFTAWYFVFRLSGWLPKQRRLDR